MNVVAVGLSHNTAPVSLRERLALPPEKMGWVLERLSKASPLKEAVVLSTCNRFEVYGCSPDNAGDPAALENFFREVYPDASINKALYRFDSKDAVRHLFRVVSGLDSMVVGETEILGQVKSAYQFAHARGTTGKITNVLFQRALYVGKQVRTKTAISEGASSVGSIAVQLAEKIFGSLQNHRILLLGAGEIAEMTARHLMSQKVTDIVVLNRTLSKAEELAAGLKGRAAPLSALDAELAQTDIVISSVSSEMPVITRDKVAAIMKARRSRSLYFIDIGVPRNVEPSVHNLDNVYVYNIDDLREIVEENKTRRLSEVERAENIAGHLAGEFYEWLEALSQGKTRAFRHGSGSSLQEI